MTRLHDLVRFDRKPRLDLPAWLERSVSLGIVTNDPNVARRQRIINVASYAAAANSASRVVVTFFYDVEGFALIQATFILFVVWALLLNRLHRFGEQAAVFGLMAWFLSGLAFALVVFGTGSQVHLYFSLGGVFILLVGIDNWRLVLAWVVMLLAATFGVLHYVPHNGLARADPRLIEFLATQTLINTIIIISVVISYALFLLERAEGELERQSARAEALVSVVLPETVAQRLRAAPDKPIADRIDGLTVLFADLVGFTPAAHTEPPESVVAYLDNLVRTFDALCEAHGLDKIKTIGDSYMAVGGLRGNSRGGALACGRFALAIVQMDLPPLGPHKLRLRIGIHCGTVIAGVIGETRIAYDLWGDAVNIAARMESHGIAGRIHVSEDFRRIADEAFAFEERGATEVKGIGVVPTYFLLRPRFSNN